MPNDRQDPVDSMAYDAHAISMLLAERKALKAEITALNDRLADACVYGAEAIRKVAFDVITAQPTNVGYTEAKRPTVEAMLVDRDAELITAI